MDPDTANPWVTHPLPTGLGDARNAIVATAGLATVAIGGEAGTLSEMALALKRGLPVIALESWTLDESRLRSGREFTIARDPAHAVELVERHGA